MPKKPVKKAMPKTAKNMECSTQGFCYCKTILAILIIVFVWASAATWSKIVITIAAILIIILVKRPCKKKQVK